MNTLTASHIKMTGGRLNHFIIITNIMDYTLA